MNVYGFSNGKKKKKDIPPGHPEKLVTWSTMYVGGSRPSRLSPLSTQGHMRVSQYCRVVWNEGREQHPGRILICKINSELRVLVAEQKPVYSLNYRIFLLPKWQVFPTEATHTLSTICPACPGSVLYSEKQNIWGRERRHLPRAGPCLLASTTPGPSSMSSSVFKILQKRRVVSHFETGKPNIWERTWAVGWWIMGLEPAHVTWLTSPCSQAIWTQYGTSSLLDEDVAQDCFWLLRGGEGPSHDTIC